MRIVPLIPSSIHCPSIILTTTLTRRSLSSCDLAEVAVHFVHPTVTNTRGHHHSTGTSSAPGSASIKIIQIPVEVKYTDIIYRYGAVSCSGSEAGIKTVSNGIYLVQKLIRLANYLGRIIR